LEPANHITLFQLLVRYWRVTVPILALAVAGVMVVQTTAPRDLRAEGAVILATPDLDWTRASGSLVYLSEALEELQQEEVTATLTTRDATLSAALTDRTTLHVGSTADRPRAAESTVSAAVAWLQDELTERQQRAGISGTDQLAARLLTPNVVARQEPDGTYVAEAAIWVDGLGGAEANPYAPSAATVRFLAITLSSADGRAAVASRIGDGIGYAVRRDPTEGLPLLTIAVSGHDGEAILTAFDEIAAVMDLELDGRQARAQVPPSRRIFVEVLARPERVRDHSPTFQNLAVVIALLGVALAGGAAGLVRRRHLRRQAAAVFGQPPVPTGSLSGAGR
jgi:hypothetical protein